MTEEELLAAIRSALGEASPRNREDLVRHLARGLGYERTGPRIRERLENGLLTAARRKIVATERGEVSLVTRSIADYSRDECVEFMLAAMRETGGPGVWGRREVVRYAARHLGFRRAGPAIQAAFKSAINAAIRRGLLERDGDDVRRAGA